MEPLTQYASSGDVHIAYQAFGDGPINLVLVPGLVSRSAGDVLVSGTVKDLVAGSGLRFSSRGTVPLKGIPGEWQIFAAEGSTSPAP